MAPQQLLATASQNAAACSKTPALEDTEPDIFASTGPNDSRLEQPTDVMWLFLPPPV